MKGEKKVGSMEGNEGWKVGRKEGKNAMKGRKKGIKDA